MGIRAVRKDPDPILRQKAEKIPSKRIKSKEIQELIGDMTETLQHSEGIGLAAPQIGESLRLIVVMYNDRPLALVNPKIIKKSWRKVTSEEGCLSLPDVFGRLRRHKSVTVKARNPEGAKVTIPAKGLESIVMQHEIDHLNGILFIDRCKKENIKKPSQA
jgi:peptide deformylase